MIVLLAIRPSVALVVGGATEFHIALGAREVLLVPLAAEGVDHLGQDGLVARCTHSCTRKDDAK